MHARATNTDETLKALAEEVLEAFEKIADAALGQLGIRHSGNGIESLAVVNQLTAQKAVQNLMEIREGREIDCRKLVKEPAIARIVVADDDDRRKTLYISRGGTVGGVPLAFCSYLSPMGQLASLSVGDYRKVRLPAGVKNFEVLEKATFAPRELSEGWDSRPAVTRHLTAMVDPA